MHDYQRDAVMLQSSSRPKDGVMWLQLMQAALTSASQHTPSAVKHQIRAQVLREAQSSAKLTHAVIKCVSFLACSKCCVDKWYPWGFVMIHVRAQQCLVSKSSAKCAHVLMAFVCSAANTGTDAGSPCHHAALSSEEQCCAPGF